ncbi:hypothetical protein [Paludibacterium yongneupense]|uniref:hypothetical protein n=1 Tax=Paludibacterium yongneupense TaxID=400061 RepID=UPI001B7FA93A|nr:hypothetical protein [Paludibacterium yongneupense]
MNRLASLRGMMLAFAVAVLCQLAMMPLDMRLQALSGGLGKLSLLFNARAMTVIGHLHAYGAEGRRLLFWMDVIDLLFPSALAWTCIQAIWLAFRLYAPRLAVCACAFPLAFAILDLAEKTLHFVLLARFPDASLAIAGIAALLTTVKLLVLVVSYAGLIAAGIAWVAVRCNRKWQ